MSVALQEADGDYAAVVVSGANAQLTDASVVAWEPALREAAALVLQNEVPMAANVAAARFMAALGRPVIHNAAPARDMTAADLAGVSLLVVNAVEAEMMGTLPVLDLVDAERGASYLAMRLRAAVVVTAGPNGAAWAVPEGAPGQVRGQPVDVVSTLGAGDAFIGHLAAALVRGASLGLAVPAANRAAARHISRAV